MKRLKVNRYVASLMTVMTITGSVPVYAEEQPSAFSIKEDGVEENELISPSEIPNFVHSEEPSTNQFISPENISENSDDMENSIDVQTIPVPQSISPETLEVDLSEEPKEHTDLTIDKDGVVTVLAEGYEIPSDVKDISVAVWSKANGQDDLKWYHFQKTETGLKVLVDLKKHDAKDGLYYFHLYYRTADDKNVNFSKVDYEVKDVFKTLVEANETSEGYQLLLTNPTTAPQKVEFAIWSEENSQDDLKWFQATYDAQKQQAVYNWDLSNLKHLGLVNVHCYVTNSAGKKVFQGGLKLEVAKPEIGKIDAVYNPDTDTYTVTLSEIKNLSYIKKIEVPTWCDSKQADLNWLQATKNADGTYSVTNSISAHGNRSGTYQVHVYVTDKNDVRVLAGKTTMTVTPSPVTSRTEEVISPSGICEIRAVNYKALDSGKDVRVAFWSDKNGQDDLKWYPLTKKTEVRDGKTETVWYAKVDLAKHGAVNGRYFAHIYYNDTTGKPVCVSPYSFTVSDLFKTSISATESNGAYKLVLSSPTVEPKSVRFAIWSEEGGQDDLYWFEAPYDAAKRESVYIWKGENLKHNGTVNVHAYAVKNDGSLVFQDKMTLEVKGITIKEIKSDYTQSSGQFKVLVSKPEGVIKKMVAAVWADSKQADLKWYQMTPDASGNWTYTGNISNHGSRLGTYNVHIYATDSLGKEAFYGKTSFTAEGAGELNINTIQKNHTYQAVVSGLPTTGVKSVSVAVWSSKNGQDDLKWYTATKSGSNYVATIPVQNHLTEGPYVAHAYVNKTDGSSYNTSGLRSEFTVDTSIVCKYAYTDRQTDNGTFVIHMADYGYIPAKSVSFDVWTEKNGQDELETLMAVKQADGSWAAVVNPAKHNFEAGEYLVLPRMVLQNGTTVTGAQTSYKVSENTRFYTVVASEESATAILRGHTDATSVKVYVWSTNGGQDDLRSYTAVKNADSWSVEIKKKDHGSAGQYNAHVYVDDVLVATDLFSFDENRLADSWYSISTAHGGGGQGVTKDEIYTNSVTAMNNSYQEGYRTFEIDVLLTSDSKPVLFHTWTTNILDHYKYSTATKAGPTYNEFMNDTMYGGKYGTADYKNLLTYLKQHPDVKILLDTKYRSADELKNLYTILKQTASSMSALSVMQNQIIPYFFTSDQLGAIRSVCSFKEYHYATYAAFPWQNGTFPVSSFQSALQFCKMNQVLSISMWDKLATAELLRMADSYGINVYVHTTDDPATAERLLKLGAAGIITNKITPVQAVGFIQ